VRKEGLEQEGGEKGELLPLQRKRETNNKNVLGKGDIRFYSSKKSLCEFEKGSGGWRQQKQKSDRSRWVSGEKRGRRGKDSPKGKDWALLKRGANRFQSKVKTIADVLSEKQKKENPFEEACRTSERNHKEKGALSDYESKKWPLISSKSERGGGGKGRGP